MTSAAPTPPRRWRSSRGWRSARRCTSTTSATRASRSITSDDIAYARELGLSLKLIGTAERLPDGISVRVHPAFLYGGHPLASVNGVVQRGHRRVGGDHRDHDVGAGRAAARRPRAPCSATSSRAIAGAPTLAPPLERLPIVEDVVSAFYVHMEVDDRPGVLAQVAGVFGDAGASIKSVVQRGTGERAQLMHGHPPARALAPRARARARSRSSTFVRSAPRAISVIDEEFE